MSAKERIETLTNGWYGFALFAGLINLFLGGFGIFSMFLTGASTLFSIAVTFFLGRRLLARSSLTRSILIFLSAVSAFLGLLGGAKLGMAFLHEWSLTILLTFLVTAGSVLMNVRSFRVLTDSSVKSYFG